MKDEFKALEFHKKLRGKLTIASKIPITSKQILSLVYTPGVAQAVDAITKNKKKVYDLTIKRNTIAVVTDGSAVLGLGNVGAEAAIPVMEGKCALFSHMAGINAFPICLATQNVDEIVRTIKCISPIFGGINIEDISAPRCFTIEKQLQNLGIPVLHDDQHATAIVVLAGLINALKLTGKSLGKSKIVIVGSGAAGTAIAKLLCFYGCTDITVVDSSGILSSSRNDLPEYKKELVRMTHPKNISGNLDAAVLKADILIGVSKKNIFTKRILKSMNTNPIVFALANPDPEVRYENAKKWGIKLFATGRSDYPNQINNALVFPGFFKGLIKSGITKISPELKIRAAKALASLIDIPTPDYFIASIFDKRVVDTIAKSVAQP